MLVGQHAPEVACGTFYEGAIVSGFPTNDTELEVVKNIQTVGYSN